jgi:hypothetical protein
MGVVRCRVNYQTWICRALRRVSAPRERLLLATPALIVALSLIEQLPNASVNAWTWLLAGALLGSAECAGQPARKRQGVPLL